MLKSIFNLLLFLFAVSTTATLAQETMRAGVITNGQVEFKTVPIPKPGAGEVRVRVHAVSVNPVDWKIADRGGDGQIAGRDFSGVIDAVGADVMDWHPGEAVTGVTSTGTYAEFTVASGDAIAKKPASMSFAEAAGLGVVADTAWRAIDTVGQVQAGDQVLIHGGAGGVGSSAVQIAKSRGAYIIATASPRNHDFLHSLGADEVIDYNTARFEEVVDNMDYVLNTADTETTVRSIGIIREGGTLVSVVGLPPKAQCEAARIRCVETGRATGEMLKHVAELVEAGDFRVFIDEQLPLSEANTAWDMNRTGHTRGKIILIVNE